jgi:excisionase family DNA binding protein
MKNSARLVDAREVAKFLGIGRVQVYRLVHQHLIPYHKVGALYRFDLAEIEKCFRQEVIAPAPQQEVSA